MSRDHYAQSFGRVVSTGGTWRSVVGRPSVKVIGEYPGLPFYVVSENGEETILIGPEFWPDGKDPDTREPLLLRNQKALIPIIGQARKSGRGIQFIYGRRDDGSLVDYEIFALELVPDDGMTMEEARIATERDRRIRFSLAGTLRNGMSFEFAFKDIGNPNAPPPRPSEYVPMTGEEVSGIWDAIAMTPAQYSDQVMRKHIIARRNSRSGGN